MKIRGKAAGFRVALVAIMGLLCFGACVRRTMTITTEPKGAIVYLNDREIGRSDVTIDFTWYGDYEITLRKEGYQTLNTHWDVRAPWYQIPPLDFFAEILWPGKIVDARSNHFVLEPLLEPSPHELQTRAFDLRNQALGVSPQPADSTESESYSPSNDRTGTLPDAVEKHDQAEDHTGPSVQSG